LEINRSTVDHPRSSPLAIGVQRVVVTDINMAFGSMVIFMVKWVIAAIPAFVILALISLTLVATMGGVVRATVSKVESD
jgi:hypothetical protein